MMLYVVVLEIEHGGLLAPDSIWARKSAAIKRAKEVRKEHEFKRDRVLIYTYIEGEVVENVYNHKAEEII